MSQRVWIVSPTTLMAVLNTARAVLKDVETRHAGARHQGGLARLAVEFGRFDERMQRSGDAHPAGERGRRAVQVTSRKISQQFQRIEAAEIDEKPADNVVRPEPDRKPGGSD